MTKIRGQRKSYIHIIIYLIFVTISIGCVSNIEENYNYNGITDTKTKIGLLLPIGSENRNLSYLGKSLRDAAFLAKEDLVNSSLEIKTYDTLGKSKEGLIAFNLALEEKNEIVIGPIVPSIAKEISKNFPFNNLKVISLSNDPSVKGTNIFLLGDTITNRANNLIRFAINNNKYRFALINPTEYENNELATILINKINMNRGIVTFSTNYSDDISEISDKAQTIKQKLKSTDTEVIIFTGKPNKRMTHLAAELADITNSKTESGVQIMGLSSWNNSTSILSEPAFQYSWFTMPDYRFRKFYENKFIKKFGYRPHPKSNLTYDAIAALGVLEKNLKNRNINHSNKFDGLFNSSGFIGIDGIFRFNYDRIAEKELSVIQITNGQPKVLRQARNSFQ
tara:strand:- start:133 stop:1314 length:1182 start_codon:yes stop_codon:yes gene_type:complete